MYELPEEEGIEYLIEMGANRIPITLSSLLNTFKDAKYDYENNYNSRIYCSINHGTNEKRSYSMALYMYKHEEYNYVAHFIDANNPWKNHESSSDDELLLIELFINDYRKDRAHNIDTHYIFINNYYSNDNHNVHDVIIDESM